MTQTANPVARVVGTLAPILVATLLVPFRESLQGATLVLVLVVVVVGVATTGDRVAAAMRHGRRRGVVRLLPDAALHVAADHVGRGSRTAAHAARDRTPGRPAPAPGRATSRRGEPRPRRAAPHRARGGTDRIRSRDARPARRGRAGDRRDDRASTSCRYSLSQPTVPVLLPDGSIDSSTHTLVDGEFALPPEGVGIRVDNGGVTLGGSRLVPGDRLGVPHETRKVTASRWASSSAPRSHGRRTPAPDPRHAGHAAASGPGVAPASRRRRADPGHSIGTSVRMVTPSTMVRLTRVRVPRRMIRAACVRQRIRVGLDAASTTPVACCDRGGDRPGVVCSEVRPWVPGRRQGSEDPR